MKKFAVGCVANISLGQTITIIGTGNGKVMQILLEDCYMKNQIVGFTYILLWVNIHPNVCSMVVTSNDKDYLFPYLKETLAFTPSVYKVDTWIY